MMGLGISQPVELLRYTHLSLGDLRDIRSREHPAAESTELHLSKPSCTLYRQILQVAAPHGIVHIQVLPKPSRPP